MRRTKSPNNNHENLHAEKLSKISCENPDVNSFTMLSSTSTEVLQAIHPTLASNYSSTVAAS